MMIGVVNERLEAVVSIVVRGPNGTTAGVDGIVDSGFMGMLSLPSKTIAMLALEWRASTPHRLADGSLRLFEIYTAEVRWEGAYRTVLVLEAETSPLLGMQIIENHELRMDVRPGGSVVIAPLGVGGDAAGETLVI